MKTYFVIMDKTANTGAEYIGEDFSNVNLLENAKKFNTRGDAERVITDNAWEEWAGVREEVEND